MFGLVSKKKVEKIIIKLQLELTEDGDTFKNAECASMAFGMECIKREVRKM